MEHRRVVRVVVDAMGGDHAPGEILAGVAVALADDPDLRVILTGPAEVVEPFADAYENASTHPTTEIIGMDENSASAVRKKTDSSIVVGCRLVRETAAEAFFSAGSTGACMAAATLIMGRIPGIARPAIAAVLPTIGSPTVLLDVGATADCKPDHLVHFAHMGSAYARTVLGVRNPRIFLLSIGEEPAKGSQLSIETHALMSDQIPGFLGNIEGHDLLKGNADVIVTDGFTGNVVLKLLEGVSGTLFAQVKQAMTSSAPRRLAAAVIAPSMRALRSRFDPDTYGGAPLLGVDGICIIGHGSSKTPAVAAALQVSTRAVREQLTTHIAGAVIPRET